MSASPERIVHLRDLFRSVWGDALGGVPSRAALQVALGVCGTEGWGVWDGEMAGSNNFGGDQTSSAYGDGVHYIGVPHRDQHYDGIEYTTYFRYYVDGGGRTAEENGAIDFLRVVGLRKLPTGGDSGALPALRAGSASRLAKAMHDSGYYEGFPPDPVANYAGAIVKNACIAADALGEPRLVTDKSINIAMAIGAGMLVAWAGGWFD